MRAPRDSSGKSRKSLGKSRKRSGKSRKRSGKSATSLKKSRASNTDLGGEREEKPRAALSKSPRRMQKLLDDYCYWCKHRDAAQKVIVVVIQSILPRQEHIFPRQRIYQAYGTPGAFKQNHFPHPSHRAMVIRSNLNAPNCCRTQIRPSAFRPFEHHRPQCCRSGAGATALSTDPMRFFFALEAVSQVFSMVRRVTVTGNDLRERIMPHISSLSSTFSKPNFRPPASQRPSS